MTLEFGLVLDFGAGRRVRQADGAVSVVDRAHGARPAAGVAAADASAGPDASSAAPAARTTGRGAQPRRSAPSTFDRRHSCR